MRLDGFLTLGAGMHFDNITAQDGHGFRLAYRLPCQPPTMSGLLSISPLYTPSFLPPQIPPQRETSYQRTAFIPPLLNKTNYRSRKEPSRRILILFFLMRPRQSGKLTGSENRDGRIFIRKRGALLYSTFKGGHHELN